MELKLLRNLWNDADTQGMDEPELLRYRSNLLGSDLRLTNFGGGNTSAKVPMQDPVTGETVQVLWVKGSGGDLGTIKRDGFATLYLDRLLALKKRYKGVAEEDAMAEMYPLCTYAANPRAASIDTPLHGFLPFRHVDHLHPDWAIALAASANGERHLERVRDETGIRLGWLPWKRPGFELGLWLERAASEGLDGIILASHGIFTWGATSKDCYENTLRVIDGIGQYVNRRIEAKGDRLFGGATVQSLGGNSTELLPKLRGKIGRSIGHFDGSEAVLRFVNSADAEKLAWLGTSCPDHFVRTRVRPLFLKDPANLDDAFVEYAREYEAYYDTNKEPNSPAMRGAAPTVVLVPGVGMFSFGKNKSEARITGEFYVNAINVMAGATALADDFPAPERTDGAPVFQNYVSLPPKEAFNIEYWSLEEAKLQRMPPEQELSRQVAVVVGASPGIGRNIAERLLGNGAHVVLLDLNAQLVQDQATSLAGKFGEKVSWAVANITDRASVREALNHTVQTYGGIDILINIAAVFIPPASDVAIQDEQWKKTFDINVYGSMIVAQEAHDVMKAQGLPTSIVLVSSANAVVSKKGSVAYDASKAAVNHLVRELSIEFAPLTRVNAVAPATVVEGSQMFPRDRVISSLAKYEIPFQEQETDDELRQKLANFYAQRTLLKQPVAPGKVAEAIYLLASGRTALTTGHILPVDAGLPEAFLR